MLKPMTQEAFAVAAGSYGEILFDPEIGVVLGYGWRQGGYPQGASDDIICLDVAGWAQSYGSPLQSDDWIDILQIEFWFRRPDGSSDYHSPACGNISNGLLV
jgi:hypothetical protein